MALAPMGRPTPIWDFLVDVDSMKFFHSGDMDPSIVTVTYLKMLSLPDGNTRSAFLQHFLFRSSDCLLSEPRRAWPPVALPNPYQFATLDRTKN